MHKTAIVAHLATQCGLWSSADLPKLFLFLNAFSMPWGEPEAPPTATVVLFA